MIAPLVAHDSPQPRPGVPRHVEFLETRPCRHQGLLHQVPHLSLVSHQGPGINQHHVVMFPRHPREDGPIRLLPHQYYGFHDIHPLFAKATRFVTIICGHFSPKRSDSNATRWLEVPYKREHPEIRTFTGKGGGQELAHPCVGRQVGDPTAAASRDRRSGGNSSGVPRSASTNRWPLAEHASMRPSNPRYEIEVFPSPAGCLVWPPNPRVYKVREWTRWIPIPHLAWLQLLFSDHLEPLDGLAVWRQHATAETPLAFMI